MAAVSDVLRPVGMLEKLYTARQVLGVYNSVIVTASYKIPSNLEDISIYTLLHAAIPGLLHRHPSLCCYFEGENTQKPIFRRLVTVKVNDVLQIQSLEKGKNIAQRLQELHDQPWPTGPKPLWKLVVIRELRNHPKSSNHSALHVALVYHHVIGDGLSGLAFHKSLLSGLESIEWRSQDDQGTPEAIDVPPSTGLFKPIEELISLPLSWMFFSKQAFQEYAPRWLIGAPSTHWAGLPTKTLGECPYHTRVRVVSIEAAELEYVLKESKEHSVPLTSLLTATIVYVLATELPGASKFIGVIPYTLRRVTGTSRDEMVNQSTAFETSYPADILDRLRKASNATDRVRSLWDTARYSHTHMHNELAKCPRDNLVGLLPYVSSHVEFYKKKIGKVREATFEVSNLGLWRPPLASLPKAWELDSMIFTQGAQPVGTAFTVNCVSVQDGSLSLAITWQDSIIQEDIVDAVAHGFSDLPYLLQSKNLSKAVETRLHQGMQHPP
ncbi:MAG: hypothetical protein Q9213_006652 [Squamulea squamosa]